jgi:phosphoglycerate dehydrogenase-like enzyme
MAKQTIVFAQGIEMPPDILALAQTMKPEEFTLRMLPPRASAEEIAMAIRDAEYLLGFPPFLADEAYTAATRLKLLQVLSAGYDYVNIAGARKARIPICANGGANSVAVAEHALMLMLAVYRKLVAFHQNVTAGRWHQSIPRTVNIYELEGKTVGLVGLGNIGVQVARRVKAFDAQVIYYDTFRRNSQEEEQLGVQYAPFTTLVEEADIISLHVPLNVSTRHLLDTQAFARMKPTAIVVNTCRGEVIDEVALIDALQHGRILAAGLDTLAKEPPDPTNPLLTFPNVTLTPHSAGPTVESYHKRFRNGYANIERVARGDAPRWIIPELRDVFPA